MMGQRAFPQLRMTSWTLSRRFYVEGLGFSVDWEHRFDDGMPVFAKLTLDGVSIFLTEHAGDCQVGGAGYLVVNDVNELCREIEGRGVVKPGRPEDTPWGTRELWLKDPDGNTLRFADPASVANG